MEEVSNFKFALSPYISQNQGDVATNEFQVSHVRLQVSAFRFQAKAALGTSDPPRWGNNGLSTWLLGEEVHWFESNGAPSGGSAFELEAHLRAASLLGRQDIARLGIHFYVGNGEPGILVGADLEKLVAKLDIVMRTEERRQLLAKVIVVRHILRIKHGEHQAEAVAFHPTLKASEDITRHFVGQIERLVCACL